jgi:hypothetical protein
MIFGWDCVSCDDFSDCHDEIVVAGVNFIGRQLIYGLYLQGGNASGSPQRGQRLRVIDLIVNGREEDFKVLR